MLIQASQDPGQTAHVVVIGNEKGGSGKSTLAIHVAIALMKAGQRVATIDLDARQQSLTHYIQNRCDWDRRCRLNLEIPAHCFVARGDGVRVDENEIAEFDDFLEKVSVAEHTHDFIVIDTPGGDTYPMRLAHAMADTLITPLNDSFVDFDVLGAVDPVTYALTQTSHYSEMVREVRRARRGVDHHDLDWILVRNRLSSANSRHLAEGLNELGLQLGFRSAPGLTERTVYRELFPRGLTALDVVKPRLGRNPTHSHLNAHEEFQLLMAALKLPIDEKSRRRAAVRSEWFASRSRPLETHDVLE